MSNLTTNLNWNKDMLETNKRALVKMEEVGKSLPEQNRRNLAHLLEQLKSYVNSHEASVLPGQLGAC